MILQSVISQYHLQVQQDYQVFSDDLQVNGVNALSIPGIDFDDSAGMISDIEVHGQGTGTGITIHHSTREQMILVT